MATTHHSLAVLTNACVKPPINPKTGLSTSLNERQLSSLIHYDEGYSYEPAEEDDAEQQAPGHLSSLVMAGPASEILPKELSNLTDDEFYQKLVQLKSEHKKTLQLCEKLYKRKINDDQSKGVNGFVADTDVGTVPITCVNGEFGLSRVNGIVNDHEPDIRYSLKDSSNKPPTGRPPPSPGSKSSPFSVGSRTAPVSKSVAYMPKARPSSAPVHKSGSISLARSLEEEVWLKIAAERKAAREAKDADNSDEQLIEKYETTQSETYESPELSAAMANIEDMWDNFSIEEYAPRPERPASATVTRREKAEKEWRHRITIPKPFKMTIREMNKEKQISQIQKEHEEKLQQKYKEEEMECQKKFKASPVPAHIYVPLYDEIMEQKEARKRYIRQYSAELLKSQEKPFNFTKREEDKKKHRRVKSAPLSNDMRKSTTFKANPVPSPVFDESVKDKIMEEEEYRKIRIKMRSKELLKAASLPPSMEARKQWEDKKRREKQMKTKKKSHFQPKVNHDVPDYDELYRHFQKELARRKREREATVVKPFQLNTMQIKSKKDKIIRDIERDEETLKENRWPYKNPRTTPRGLGVLSTSLDSIPAKTTASSDLRSSHTRQRMHELTKKEREQLEADRKRRVKEMRLRSQIVANTTDGETKSLDETYKEKLHSFRKDDHARMENYRKELEEMNERVKKRPLLFQQESQINAKASAEKKFAATLKSHGIDEDFVQSRSSRAASVVNDDDYEDDFDATYIRSGNERDEDVMEDET